MTTTETDHDPEAFAEKLRYWRERGAPGRLKRQGQTNTRIIPREDHPGVAGYQTEHWSGRVDAVATPESHHQTMKGQ